MDVGTVPAVAPDGAVRGRLTGPLSAASDEDLVALIRAGDRAAFEAVDARYRAAILGYCRHLLGDRDEAEDAVQHTFFAAYTSVRASEQPIELRPWLYTIARNRCYSLLRGRREVSMAELEAGTSEEPGVLVQRLEELRDLVLDVNRLPEDQRAALVMAELGAHSHEEIAGALEVPRAKVKALVFQARESLVATRTAREIDCAEIRHQLRGARGAGLRRGTLRRHLHECAPCREYRRELRRQRTSFAAVLPFGPLLALRSLLLRSGAAGRSMPTAGGAGTAGVAIKLGALKPVAGALAAILSAASAVVAVHSMAPRVDPIAHVAHARHAPAARVARHRHPARAARVVAPVTLAAHRRRAALRAGRDRRLAWARRGAPAPAAAPALTDGLTARDARLLSRRVHLGPRPAPPRPRTPAPTPPRTGGTAVTIPAPTASPIAASTPPLQYGAKTSGPAPAPTTPAGPPAATPGTQAAPEPPRTSGPGDAPGDHTPSGAEEHRGDPPVAAPPAAHLPAPRASVPTPSRVTSTSRTVPAPRPPTPVRPIPTPVSPHSSAPASLRPTSPAPARPTAPAPPRPIPTPVATAPRTR